jgi:hypothetical protein
MLAESVGARAPDVILSEFVGLVASVPMPAWRDERITVMKSSIVDPILGDGVLLLLSGAQIGGCGLHRN